MNIATQLFLATLFGALIGLERQSSLSKDNASGIRTYALLSLLGAIGGVLYDKGFIVPYALLLSAVSVLIALYYVLGSLNSKNAGFTTEIVMLYAVCTGFLTTVDIIPLPIVVAIVVVTILILSLKEKTKRFVLDISRNEINSFISYAIVALVVLPFLPDQPYLLSDIPLFSAILGSYGINLGQFAAVELFNPRKLWLIVALITGIDVFGYVLQRIVGQKKSFMLTSFVGGFISSTSTTQALAQKSTRLGAVNSLVGAAIMANLASFFQVFLLVGPLNQGLVAALAPVLFFIIFAAGLASAIFICLKDRAATEDGASPSVNTDRKIFSLSSALKFALLITGVKILTKAALALFGESGFFISSVIASFAGLDAILISLADLAGKTISFETAVFAFILVNATNLVSKLVYSIIQGTRRFTWRLAAGFIVIIAASVAGHWFF